MQGYLQRVDSQQGLIFRDHVIELYAVLKRNILVLFDSKESGNVVGRVHMQIATLAPVRSTDNDCDFRLNSGLVELCLRAPSIGDKCQWHNALSDAIR